MDDLESSLRRLRELQFFLELKKTNIRKLEELVKDTEEYAMSIFKVPYLRALERYNETSYYTVDTTRTNFILDLDTWNLNMYARLIRGKDIEPIGKMIAKDVRGIQEALSLLIVTELRVAVVAIPFGYISVPSDYYK